MTTLEGNGVVTTARQQLAPVTRLESDRVRSSGGGRRAVTMPSLRRSIEILRISQNLETFRKNLLGDRENAVLFDTNQHMQPYPEYQ